MERESFMKFQSKWFWLARILSSYFVILNLIQDPFVFASLQLDMESTRFVLKNSNSQIRFTPTTISGWQSDSIIANASNAGLGDYNLLLDAKNIGNSTYPSSGNIINYPGVPNTLIGSNWNIPANTVIHVTANAVLDGNNNTINLGNNSQIFIDDTVTLTLRNVVIDNTENFAGNPPIKLATSRSKIVFDNARLNLSNDFYFDRGQMFAYNDVNVTGTSAIIYRSASPSYIMSGANLKFNPGTTFAFAPSTTSASGILAKDLFVMGDATSKLTLDGASLKTTLTGMRLTKGQLLLGNKVTMTSAASLQITGTSYAYQIQSGTTPNYIGRAFREVDTLQWSPDGRMLAVAGQTREKLLAQANNVAVYLFSGSTTTTLAATAFSVTSSGVSWSPDGQYIAAGGKVNLPLSLTVSTSNLQVYSIVNNTLSTVAQTNLGTTRASYTGPVSWSPDGHYLAVGGNMRNLTIYQFNGTTLNQVSATSGVSEVLGISWHPSGKYIAIATNSSTNSIAIYSFNNGNGALIATSLTRSYASFATNVAWSPDGNFLAATGQNGSGATAKDITIYSFNGANPASPTLGAVATAPFGVNARVVKWSPDGRFILVGGNDSSSSDLTLYMAFTGSSLVPLKKISYGTALYACDLNPNGLYLAVGGSVAGLLPVTGSTQQELQLAQVAYGQEAYNSQAISNSIVFGNSALGSSYDLNLQLLSGANVSVDGILNYDNTLGYTIFSNNNACFTLKASNNILQNNSEIRMSPNTVLGWRDRSLTKTTTGQGLGDYNLVNYEGANKIVSYAKAPTELVYDNSNAVVGLTVTTRINSNALIYLNRTTSNSIAWLYGMERGNSNLLRVTSNAANYLSTRVRTDSNAFLYGIKNSSNAIINLSNNVQVFNTQQVYNHPATIQNFAWYKAGFQVDPGVILALNTPIPVNGQISLGGTLTLSSDLFLEAGATFTSSYGFGEIYGNGNAIHLGGNLAIPSNNLMHIGANTIIEGDGNTVNIGNNSQIFVDDNVTLTLRNVVISNNQNFANNPPIELATSRSKLVLDNARLNFVNDFYFNQGELFCYNDVNFTGTSSFIYRSTVPSQIMSGANLKFNPKTTFYFEPATSGVTGLLAKDLLMMGDATSKLTLDGASLKTTLTGMRLTNGQLLLSNNVTMTSATSFRATGTSAILTLGTGIANAFREIDKLQWSPDGRKLAVAGQTREKLLVQPSSLSVYLFSGTTTSTLATVSGC